MDKIEEAGLWCWARLLFAVAAWSMSNTAFGWIYPEHRDIAVLAVEGLDPERKAEFDRLWQEARVGDEARLCVQSADTKQGVTPECIDWAALSGIAGDHSCSSQEMLETARKSEWILQVADVAAQLKVDLSAIPVTATADQTAGTANVIGDARRRLADEASRAKRVNALRAADTRLQRADPKYASRADSNLAHFLLARPDTNLDAVAYAELALRLGSELNAPGVYVWYHTSALQKASRLANEQLSPDERRALARSALFDEAFALHFLEDMYASGHIAGSWGDVSQRKGTHDFYNQNGLEVFTWKGRDRTIVLMGDAHMRPEDADLAAQAIRTSLEQVLDTAPGAATAHLREQGYDLSLIPVEGLSSTTRNAKLIRDALMSMPAEPGPPRIVLIGYSKGSNDILEAVVAYPELRPRVAAYVSIAGSIGGSPLANDAEQDQADLLRHFPGATCGSGDGGAVASLRPDVRRQWLAANPLPEELQYYSLVTFPQPERISSILKQSYDKLSRVDARNDSQVIFYDQVLPGSMLVAYLNADHWAVAVPIARTHTTIAALFVTQNAYPREALAEALLRFVEEDMEASQQAAPSSRTR